MFLKTLVFLTGTRTVANLAVRYTLCGRYTWCAHCMYLKSFPNIFPPTHSLRVTVIIQCESKMFFFKISRYYEEEKTFAVWLIRMYNPFKETLLKCLLQTVKLAANFFI